MKTKNAIFITMILLIFCASASAIDWKTTNQATVAWNAVETLIDGSPLPAGSIIKYEVYLANATTDPQKTNPVKLTDPAISELEYTLTLNSEGKYFVGVCAVRFDGEIEVGRSEINWSDINGEQTPNPFGLIHYFSPAIPTNLR